MQRHTAPLDQRLSAYSTTSDSRVRGFGLQQQFQTLCTLANLRTPAKVWLIECHLGNIKAGISLLEGALVCLVPFFQKETTGETSRTCGVSLKKKPWLRAPRKTTEGPVLLFPAKKHRRIGRDPTSAKLQMAPGNFLGNTWEAREARMLLSCFSGGKTRACCFICAFNCWGGTNC